MVFVITKVVCGLRNHQDCNPIFCFGFVHIPLSVEEVVLWVCSYPSCVEVIVQVVFGFIGNPLSVEVIVIEFGFVPIPLSVEVIVVVWLSALSL